MSVSTHIAFSWARQLERKIITQTVNRLRQMTDTLSGDDSGLINTWDEICVQVQGEESFYASMYRMTCEGIIEGFVEELSHEEQEVLWINTPDGLTWWDEHEDHSSPVIPVYTADIVPMVYDSLMAHADSYSNRRIRKYLEIEGY